MADYLPKAEQLDTMNQRLAELNEHLQKREDFTAAMAKLDSATKKAESLKDGFSPTATVTQTSTGADISVTDKNGTTNAHIENGSDANVTKENVVSALGYTPLESAPVTSVNGKTGAVELAASDVGAISSADGSVQNAHLADSSVTTDKLAEAERMTSANIVGALGYEPEEKSGEWELIEEITLTEDTAEIVRTAEPDGTALNLVGCTVTETFPSWATYNRYMIIGGVTLGATKYSMMIRGSVILLGNMWFPVCYYGSSSSVSDAGGPVSGGQLKTTADFSTIRYIRIYSTSDGYKYPAGTTIKIYGIRA